MSALAAFVTRLGRALIALGDRLTAPRCACAADIHASNRRMERLFLDFEESPRFAKHFAETVQAVAQQIRFVRLPARSAGQKPN